MEPRLVQGRISLTGWIMARPGSEVTLTAPVAGYVRPPRTGKEITSIGLSVAKDQEVCGLEPVLSPVEQIQMAALKRGFEMEMAKARENLAVAESECRRIQELFHQKLRGQQDLEQAEARRKIAQEELASALDKRKLFAEGSSEQTASFLRPVGVRAPRDGIVLTLLASPGQYVPVAAPLMTIADLSELWVRVPVPENDLSRIEPGKPASLTLKGIAPGDRQALEIPPVALVPLVDPVKHTADMIYELKPRPKRQVLARDQMVTVQVPLEQEHPESVVPYAAVVFDAYAGTWVYLDVTPANSDKRIYERRRVELGQVIGEDVVIRPPLKAGERVVTAGAAAIFSREFHKPPIK
jgi:cobalt-zinc-cadmium efflux system membrane fusion protein